MNKYEQLIEAIIQEDDSRAKEIFHDIVVEKSRDIYESLSEEDVDVAEIEDDVDGDELSETFQLTSEDAKTLLDYAEGVITESEENSDLLERVAQFYGVEVGESLIAKIGEDNDDLIDVAYGDDETVDSVAMDDEDEEEMDFSNDEMDSEEGEAEVEDAEVEDRVFDLEQAMDELKAEFDALMGDEEEADMDDEEEVEMDDEEEADMDDEEEVEMDDDDEEEVEMDEQEGDAELNSLREYVEKVANPGNKEGADNTTSTVAKKNSMGGTTANIAQGSAEEKGAKVTAPKEIDSGNKNVPGGDQGLEATPKPKTKGE